MSTSFIKLSDWIPAALKPDVKARDDFADSIADDPNAGYANKAMNAETGQLVQVPAKKEDRATVVRTLPPRKSKKETPKQRTEAAIAAHNQAVQEKKDENDSKINWIPWLLAGGGGLLAHSIASSMMGPDDKNSSWWRRLLATIIPLGIGGLGAYGGYTLGEEMNKSGQARQNKNPKKPARRGRPRPAQKPKPTQGGGLPPPQPNSGTNATQQASAPVGQGTNVTWQAAVPADQVGTNATQSVSVPDTRVPVRQGEENVFRDIVRDRARNPTVPGYTEAAVEALAGIPLTYSGAKDYLRALGILNPHEPSPLDTSRYAELSREVTSTADALRRQKGVLEDAVAAEQQARSAATREENRNRTEEARVDRENTGINAENARLNADIATLEQRNNDLLAEHTRYAAEVDASGNPAHTPAEIQDHQRTTVATINENRARINSARDRLRERQVYTPETAARDMHQNAEDTLTNQRETVRRADRNAASARRRYKGKAAVRGTFKMAPGLALDARAIERFLHARGNGQKADELKKRLLDMGIPEETIQRVLEEADKNIRKKAPWTRIFW